MSVSRRNTFDIFNESRDEASVYITHDANSILKKKRKKKKKPGNIPHTSDHIAAADVTSQVGPDEPEAGSSTDALSSQTAPLSSNSSDQLLPTLDSKLYIGGLGPAPADSSSATASTTGHLSEGKQEGSQATSSAKAGADSAVANRKGQASVPSSPSKARRPAPEPPDAGAHTGTAPPNSTFGQYLWAELNPYTAAPPSVIRHGLVERQRVYNAIMIIPYQLERLLWYGLLVCLDSFLAVFTVLPVRFAKAVAALVRPNKTGGLQGDQLFDLLCVLIFAATLSFLRLLPAGTIYFWLKDLTQEFLKLHVVHSAVEIFDKISCSFAVDALEALSGTCGLYLSSSGRRWHAVQLLADMLLALGLIVFHSMVLICQFMTFSVAINSRRSSALIALLIASNFVEIKGTIFKRFDPSKLFILVGQDVTERFHLLLTMAFVAVEEMDNAGTAAPSAELLRRCAIIFGAEVVIDVIKHAVLTKLNDIRPAVYQRFMKDVCEKAKGGQSHTAHRVVAFEPYAPAALFLRIALTLLVIKGEQLRVTFTPVRTVSLALMCLACWMALFAAKALLGFSLRGIAQHFLQRHQKLS